MTAARWLESCLWSLKSVPAFIRILEVKFKIPLVLTFTKFKCCISFLCFQNCRRDEEFCSGFDNFGIKLKSAVILTVKKGRPHFWNPGLRELCGYCFNIHTCKRRLTTECLEYIELSMTTFKSIAAVMFRGTPCRSQSFVPF